MQCPPSPDNEHKRLAALEDLGLVYSPSEARFDRITKLARHSLRVPIALISLITDQCQWFKSAQGITASETSREISFCGHAILSDELFVVSDTLADPRFADNPLVSGEPYIRFYAGHPVRFNGQLVGTLCVIDTLPRDLSSEDRVLLHNLATWVEKEFKASSITGAQKNLLHNTSASQRKDLIDPVSKIWRRPVLNELLAEELAATDRRVSALLITVRPENHRGEFALNDEQRMELAAGVRSCVSPGDLLVQYGDSEILLFTGGRDRSEVQWLIGRVGARIEKALGEQRFVPVVGAVTGVFRRDQAQALLQAAEAAFARARAQEDEPVDIVEM